MKKILIALVLVCLMASAVAFSGSGSGTEGSPYLITNCTSCAKRLKYSAY